MSTAGVYIFGIKILTILFIIYSLVVYFRVFFKILSSGLPYPCGLPRESGRLSDYLRDGG